MREQWLLALLCLSLILVTGITGDYENEIIVQKRDVGLQAETTDLWNLWGEWTQENADTWSRSRTCKLPGKCTGNAIQRRKKSAQETTTVENIKSEEDYWNLWGEWTQENADTWSRSRTCKVPGKCTGNAIQRRKKSAQETTTVENVKETDTAIGDDYWEQWGEWTQESATSVIRTRLCKVAGKCTGNSLQRRQKSTESTTTDMFPKDEFPEDWNAWSEWTFVGEGTWTRKRTCKNSLTSGKCRGVSGQTKKVSVGAEEVEVPEDWGPWSTWSEETLGFWIRTRDCKNKGVADKCRGSTLQRKTKKVQYQYEMEVDKDEVLEDWEAWGEWVDEFNGNAYRKRVCKNTGPSAKCRGKATQKRIRTIKDTSAEDDKDAVITSEHFEDWDQWEAWGLDADGWWVRARKCKNKPPSGNCRGISSQKRKTSGSVSGEADWNLWSEWTRESEGIWTRKRTCKNKESSAKCAGSSLQRRITKITYIYTIENDAYEVAEDWETWGEWVTQSDTVSIRKRICKNDGANANCRGLTTQKRIREIKTEEKPQFVIEEEVPEDWGPWSQWTSETSGVFVRKRSCLNKSGKCTGDSIQKKTETVAEEYTVDVDKDEVPYDWENWGAWVDQLDGTSKRVRICKNKGPQAKCRGKSVQIRKLVKKPDDGPDNYPEDWNSWSEWASDSDDWFLRTRTCKNPVTSGKCRGPSSQRKKVIGQEVEALEDWEAWAQWTKESEGVWTRKRYCKTKGPSAKCRGSSLQRRTLKISYIYVIEYHPDDVAEDWETWGEWVSESETTSIRKRLCKNKGLNAKCRGISTQKRTRVIKTEKEPQYIIEEEVPEDWGSWSTWSLESTGVFVRNRTCVNMSGKCRGISLQKKTITISDEYEVEIDKDEVLGDWENWGEWMDQPDGDGKRIRVCKNKGLNAKCRGKSVQIRKRIKKPGSGTEEEQDQFPEDWNPWSEWTSGVDNWWSRSRTCKNPLSSGKCRGPSVQKRKLVSKPVTPKEDETVEVITDWFNWGPWELEVGGTWVRRRKCRNNGVNGLCRGKSIEKSKTKPETIKEDQKVPAPVNGAWGLWGPWSLMTGATNPETLTRTRKCDNPAPSDGGKSCEGVDKDTKLVYKPIDGNWGPWSSWSEALPDSTVIYRTRQCNSPVPLYNGKACFGPEREVLDVINPTDGNWGQWTTWSTRTGLSNPETVKRNRLCNNPSPSNRGKPCKGEAEQSDVIYNPIDGKWTEWGPWSSPEKGGTKIKRTRKCSNPKPQNGGRQCVGPEDEAVDAVLPTDGKWGPWGPWSELSGSTNPETRYRKRACDNPSPANGGSYCAGFDQDEETVYKPIDGAWGEWSPWSDPTADSNTVSRTRGCNSPVPAYGGKDCPGSATETKDVIKPVDGNWGEWGTWSELTHKSNPEVANRKRYCDNPTPSNGGKTCPGKEAEEKEFYTPIDGGYTEWSQWEVLVTGKKRRTRKCTNPTPKFGGTNCAGTDEEVVDIVLPTDGNWGSWSVWSVPTGLTNPETITRKRSCENPSPANGGRKCEGSDTDALVIKRPIDGDWSSWTEWALTKDGENKERKRECNSPQPLFGGEDCKGSQHEVAHVIKPIDGNWGPWQDWSPITGTLNPETIRRRRLCNNPSTSGDGKNCPGSDTEEQLVFQPIDGNWSEWSQWIDDSSAGTKTRKRECNSPSPQYNGRECAGESKETVDIIKPTDGQWGDWSPWSEPTKAFNPETALRRRSCDNPTPANGGKICEGDDKESKVIYHPINGNWGEWSDWSQPEKDSTSVKRTRKCDSPVPKHGGLECIGGDVETKDIVVPTDGNWGPWGPFSEPTWKTNPEAVTRNRYCDNPSPANGGAKCAGSNVESKLVYRPIDGKWSEWSSWSEPLPDSYKLKRTRKCDNPAPLYNGKSCEGPSDEEKDVIKPTDGNWGEWNEWSKPKYETNPEKIIRVRYCNNPTPANNGKNCEGDNRETKEIFTPVNGNWGEWTEWAEVEGDDSILKRSRKCDSPAVQYGGADCVGQDSETKPIFKPVDGKWREWGPWSEPVGDTNPKILKRTRACDSPTPANGGLSCSGSPIETQIVTEPIDGGWTTWSEWSLPLGLTNPENVTRTRTCTLPSPAYNGKPCVGNNEEVKEVTRPIDGNWGPWSSWIPPSETKIEDTYLRKRKCDNPIPKYGGKECFGNDTESKFTPNPVEGNWGPWGKWSEPTWKNNPDLVVRLRNCDSPAPKNGGKNCEGLNTDTKEVTKPIDGSWGPWSSWSVPEGVEPPVNATRTRGCSDPEPRFGGGGCDGPETEVKLINKPTPVDGGWSDWSAWSEAPEVANIEIVNRTRTCSHPEPLFGGKKCEGLEIETKNVTKPLDGNWGKWGPWSVPKGESNPEVLTRSRRCDSPAPLFGGAFCFGSDVDKKNHTSPVNGRWTDWGEWSKPLGLSNPETLTRTRSCTNPAPAFGGEACTGGAVEGKEYFTPVDGQWSPWSEWSTPLGLEQPETLKRTRRCNSPSPSNGGKTCEGLDSETKEYYKPTDGNWGPWSDWSTPTGTSDREVITRSRNCDTPAPKFGGKECEGASTENTTIVKEAPKPVDGQWGEWGEWTKPSKLVNPETLSRVRFCDNPTPAFGGVTCPGKSTETKLHYNPVDGRWGEWSSWSVISEDEEKEDLVRYRECDSPEPERGGKDCEGDADESIQIVKKNPQPIDGSWGPWSEWKVVPSSENPTNKTRYRTCDNPSPQFGGADCKGDKIEAKLFYKPIDGLWGEWSEWTEKVALGNVVTLVRQRKCDAPAPKYDGKDCQGSKEETTEIVKEYHTPVDGQWGPWTEWSKPLKLTNPETLSRSRVCDSPTPVFGGKDCQGQATELKDVYNPIDGNWGEWSQWSEPTELVNPEIIKRKRKCDSPATEFGGAKCVGDDVETKEVFTPVNGGWNEWSDWLEVAGTNTKKRSRRCDSPYPAYGGKTCEGQNEEIVEIVEEKPQPINGNWGPWGEWTSLVKTEKTETFTRGRSCDNPTPNFGGKDCEGVSTESRTANLPVDGNWNPWSEWSTPIGTADVEIVKRTRKCNNPTPNYGGKTCDGESEQIRTAQKDVPTPIDGGWTEWSDWTVESPDGNVIKRTRSCTNPIPQNNGKDCSGPSTEKKAKTVCPKNYHYLVETNKCYKVIPQRLTWEGARRKCSKLGPKTHLVTIDSQGEQTGLQRFLTSRNSTLSRKCFDPQNKYLHVWTAAKRIASQPGAKFVWLPYSDREPKPIIFSTWRGNAPNEKPTEGEQCVYFDLPDFKWVDGPCGCTKGGTEEEENVVEDYEYDYEYDDYGEYETSEDSTEEPEGWDLWTEWTKDDTGYWVRERKCKRNSKPCIGRNIQKRKYIKQKTVEEENESLDSSEVLEDWLQWSVWTKEQDYWVRRRKCKNDIKSGNCRGKDVQRKKYLHKQKYEYDYQYEYDDSEDNEVITEIGSDWGPWMEWSAVKNGKSVRVRNCFRAGGNCVGKNIQMRKVVKKIVKKTDEDNSFDSTEISEGWGLWSQWTQDEDLFWVRRRTCKKENENCLGRSVQYKKRLVKKEDDSDSIDSTEVPEDWETWSTWTQDENLYWIRRRKCKKIESGGKCQGRSVQRKKHLKKKWQKIKDGEEDVDSTEEPEGWDNWSSWAKDSKGYLVRKRSCKNGAGKCKGKNVQRKRVWKITKESEEAVGSSKYWSVWSEWTEDGTSYWVRRRKCLVPHGMCRGKSVQKKKLVVKEHEENSDEGWSAEKVTEIVLEVPEDWNEWGQWRQQEGGWWVRKRMCKNVGINCRGRETQKKRRRSWRIDKSYAYTADGSKEAGPENVDDWEMWGDWEIIGSNLYIRRRACKNQQSPCRGRKTQKRKKIVPGEIATEDIWEIEKFTGEEVPEDWNVWSTWIWSDDEGWFRERSCKNGFSDETCRGPRKQKRVLKLEWIKKKKADELLQDDFSLVLSDDKDAYTDSDGWDKWGPWEKTSEMEMTRKRRCKKADGTCKGKDTQKRRERTWKVAGSWSIDESKDSALEVTDDWKPWAEWTQIGRGLWTRTRKCKNSGPGTKCRGSKKQTRRKKGWSYSKWIKQQWKWNTQEWVIDISFDQVPDFPGDWELWGEWVTERDGSEVRHRKCKEGSSCRGKNKQRRIQKVTTWREEYVEGENEKPEAEDWSVELSPDDTKSVSSEWDQWTEWTVGGEGLITRERKCLKTNGKCKGKKLQKKVKRNWVQVGEFLIDDGLIPGESDVDQDWKPWSEWALVKRNRWVRTRECKNSGGSCRGSIKQIKKKGRKMKLHVNVDPSSWSVDVQGDGSVPEVLEDWELWGEWKEDENNTLRRKRFCKNSAFGGKCRGNSVEWRRRRKWTHVGEWSYDVPPGDVTEIKEDWLSWGQWIRDSDGSWMRFRNCKNGKDGPCRGKSKQRRRTRKTFKFDVEGFKKFIFGDKSPNDEFLSSWGKYLLEKVKGTDAKTAKLWYKKLIEWQEGRDGDWKAFKLGHSSDEDLFNKFKEGFQMFQGESTPEDYEWETELVIKTTEDGKTVEKTYKGDEIPEEFKTLLNKTGGEWKTLSTKNESNSGTWTSVEYQEEVPEEEEMEWTVYKAGSDGQMIKQSSRRKRSVEEQDTTCGINMCALCEVELE